MSAHIRGGEKAGRKKAFAIMAGGLVLGLGVTATLAAWTDTEWIFGGNAAGDGPGVGTSTFEVEQNTSSPYVATAFDQFEANPGDTMIFGVDALALSPGDAVYAPVALRTIADSLGGSVELQAAVEADESDFTTPSVDPDGLLWGALDLRVSVAEDAVLPCTADAFAPGATIIADGPLATADGSIAQELDAESGNVQHYCFELTLPEAPTLPVGFDLDDLQGLSIAPAWEFAADSTVLIP
ncbi:SipW-dependent-type signal peptide-containing protein [Compostimonas suwonensis]|uniref:Putative ribosomally synthesized peptide with SipW-like signal peptide n=1 Tax=Compostimonas suwonensis TaxID=1048394 RepID=A0A2M9BCI0_9MICO|nr:SipW-dependent-type signal peptide-containing protein [Compostimonas suwonensis]PJJ55632.1 putative ribosomally synthesized peptide with SipW-like signal peptide [Compostimonas suwonensis]